MVVPAGAAKLVRPLPDLDPAAARPAQGRAHPDARKAAADDKRVEHRWEARQHGKARQADVLIA